MIHPLDSTPADLDAASGMYALLAQVWLREVDLALLSRLRSPEVRPLFQAAGGELPADSEVEHLAVEYCRMFVGPQGHLPPLQSVWERGELQSDITSSIRSFADAAGYQTPAGGAFLAIRSLGCPIGHHVPHHFAASRF